MNINKAIYICGDFNVDLLKNNIHTSTNTFLDMLYRLGMYPLISKPTRITSRGRGGITARLRFKAPWLENCVRHDCDISHSE